MTEPNTHFLALLAHELRTPVSTIIGYHDLISEGILGDVDPRLADGLDRIRKSANQLLALVAGLGEASVDDVDNLHVEIDSIDPRELTDSVLLALSGEAGGRGSVIDVEQSHATHSFATDPDRVQRALLLALHAAIKTSAGHHLKVHSHADETAFVFTVNGTRLDAGTDDFRNGTMGANTAAGMRLAMALQAVRPVGGSLSITAADDGTTRLEVRVPVL